MTIEEKLREAAVNAAAARHVGRHAAMQELDTLRALINPEVVLALLAAPKFTAEMIEDRITQHAKHVGEAATIARAVAREKGSDR